MTANPKMPLVLKVGHTTNSEELFGRTMEFYTAMADPDACFLNYTEYTLKSQADALAEALSHYADISQYEGISLGVCPLNDDRGNKARAALAAYQEGE